MIFSAKLRAGAALVAWLVIATLSPTAEAQQLDSEASASEPQSPPQRIRRFAIIAGSNNGGTDRVELKYAESDAATVASVLSEFGGVQTADQVLLSGPSKSDFLVAFVEMGARIEVARAGSARTELILYYSGHSDEQGLLLDGERLRYKELRSAMDTMDAEVHIAILDSCSSGALTRNKGGQRRPPFLMDASTNVKGHAFLTSASADEAAQESDAIGGSFFTHYLVSGLRGAADVTGDSKVSLNEAYQFAFNETLARTESTRSGPQHPNYDIQLTGAGDLVLTDLRSDGSRLVLDRALRGRVSVRDDGGHLVAELFKTAGREVALGLEPGTYQVTVEKQETWFRGNITLAEGSASKLAPADLSKIEAEETTPRGSETAAGAEDYWDLALVLGAGVGDGPLEGTNPMVFTTAAAVLDAGRLSFQLRLRYGSSHPGEGDHDSVPPDPGFPDSELELIEDTVLGSDLTIAYHLVDKGWLTFGVGARGGLDWLKRDVFHPDDGTYDKKYLISRGGAVLQLSFRPWEWLGFYLEGGADINEEGLHGSGNTGVALFFF